MRKKRTLVIGSVVLFTISALIVYKAIFTGIVGLPKEINLGNINLSDKPTFSFDLKNKGNQSIEVARIYTSCGCTSVISPEKGFVVKPGNSGKITVQFDPSSMHKKGDDVYHEIYILTTKPTEKEYLVKMKGKIL